MGRNKWFEFKKFKIHQERAAMKVNTDGVLLGAWTNLAGAKNILDVGTGTGLIALMAAQRCGAVITGIEIEKNAAEEAVINVRNSLWNDRISISHISFQQFAEITETRFDVIVSNPPFFSNGVKNSDPHLSMARHNYLLPFTHIILGAKKLLQPEGTLALILPAGEAPGFIENAHGKNLFPKRITRVIPYPGKEPNRFLMEFGNQPTEIDLTQLAVFDETRINYSAEFISLARDFYLKL